MKSLSKTLALTLPWLAVATACNFQPREATDSVGEALSPYPEIDFSTHPSYLANNTLALTFDDGPDYTNTAKVLDILRANSVKATFFINTENWSSVNSDAPMQDLVRRMVNEGHQLGNHTVHHLHLPTLSAASIESEISGVETTVKNIFGASAPKITLFRAPFGEPYQDNDPNSPSADYKLVAPIVAKHAVEIGWAADEFDYDCPVDDGDCVVTNFKNVIGTVGNGAYGVVLMHSVHSATVNGLQRIIDYTRSNGFKLVQVEDVVKARYGKTSAQIISGGTTGGTTGGSGGGAITNNGTYSFKTAVNTANCMDISGGSTANGAQIQEWTCNGSGAQTFKTVALDSTYYKLVNPQSGKCLDIAGGLTADGTKAELWSCNGGANQAFKFVSSGGNYNIVGKQSGKCIDVSGAGTANGTKVQLWTCNGSAAQKWGTGSGGTTSTGGTTGTGGTTTSCTYPNWQAGHAYVTGNIVHYTNGNNYIATNDNPGYDPTISTWYWSPYTAACTSSSGGSTGGSTGSTGSGGTSCSSVTSWQTGARTYFTSYPAPGSEECIAYSGCMYEGMFQNCNKTLSQSAVAATNIISVFPATGGIHLYCLKTSAGKTLAAYTIDTCADSDCSGCCTANKGGYAKLIDVEVNTSNRLGSTGDSTIQFADMGPAPSGQPAGCN